VSVSDRSTAGWAPLRAGQPPDRRGTTIGEGSIYVMLYDNDVIPGDALTTGTGRLSYYNYSHPRSDGWAGDRLVPYADADAGSDAGYGYVWATEWDTAADAERFRSSYVLMLKLRHGARLAGDGTDVYEISSGPYADAFRVTRTGDRVVIVNAPTVDALDDVRARE
jgi:hypothetical protein